GRCGGGLVVRTPAQTVGMSFPSSAPDRTLRSRLRLSASQVRDRTGRRATPRESLRRSSDTMARTTRLPGDPVLEQRGSGQSGDGHRHHRRPRVVMARERLRWWERLPPTSRLRFAAAAGTFPPSPPAQGDKATAAGTFPPRLRLKGTKPRRQGPSPLRLRLRGTRADLLRPFGPRPFPAFGGTP